MKYKLVILAILCLTFVVPTYAQKDYKQWAEVALLPFIDRAQTEVDNFDPQTQYRLVSEANFPWMFRAVSLWARGQYYKEKGIELKPYLDPAFDKLAEAARKKLATYVAGPTNFSYHNVGEEKMVRTAVADWAPKNTIYKTGFTHTGWRIDKNDYGLPTARYKWGKALVKVTGSDHPYCWLVSVNIIQDYAGGGTYGSSYARQVDEELVGCPAGN